MTTRIDEMIEEMAHACFNAGFSSGADDYRTARGGKYFNETKAYKKMKETISYLTKALTDRDRIAYERGVREGKKQMEQEWMLLKDDYSELARAIGVEGDSFWGDPLCSHKEVLKAAKALTLPDNK